MNTFRLPPFIALLSFLALGGCTTSPSEQAQQLAEERTEIKRDKAKEDIDSYPDWYLDVEKPKPGVLHVKRKSTLDDGQAALDDAMFNAEFELARAINNEVSGLTKVYMNKHKGSSASSSRTVIESLVNKTDVTGYYVTKRTVDTTADGEYRAFVWLTWDLEHALEVRKSKVSKDVAFSESAKEMFEELDEKTSTPTN